jgi:hypothetical protein
VEVSASALGTGADDGAGPSSRNHADVLRRRKFGRRWWRYCCDRDAGWNIYDHGVCERDSGFDHVNPRHEAHIDRAIAASAG